MTQSSDLVTNLTQSSSLSPDRFLVELIRNLLGQGKECRFQAKGYSMSPFIKDGDIITLAPLERSSFSIGDVVAFIHPDSEKLIIHRIVGKRDNDYCVRGDNALEADGLVQAKEIFGYVKRVERNGKNIRIGLGPERFLIAFLTRKRLLFPLISPLWKIIRPFIKLGS